MSAAPRFDLCVIGGGPAGYAAAMRAHDLGKRVVLVDAWRLGGAGVHRGALSSKTLWELSRDYARSRRTDRGYLPCVGELEWSSVQQCVQDATSEREQLLERQVAALHAVNAAGASVDFWRGKARFLDAHTVRVTAADGAARELHADAFVIATGSSPRSLPDAPCDGVRIVSSDQIEGLLRMPASLVIIGSGVIGCEYATIFSNLGHTEIAMIDRQERILPFEDADVAAVVAQRFEAKGVHIHKRSQLRALRALAQGVEFELESASGERTTHTAEVALVAIGRVPNTAGLGLEAAGVRTAPNGAIVVSGTQTSAPHIHAAGDVTADVSLANVAELEGRQAIEALYGLAPRPVPYDALSLIMFLDPEVASAGVNEQQAKAQGIAYRAAVVSNRLSARHVAMRATDGFVKLLVGADDGRVIGLRVVGPQASATVQAAAFLIELGASLQDIERCVHPHPGVPEGVQECARLLLGRSLYKPEVLGPELLRVVSG